MRIGAYARGAGEFCLSLGASYLPRFYRERWIHGPAPDLRRGALVSGILQFFLCLALLIFGYFRWIVYIGAAFARAYAAHEIKDLSQSGYQAGVGMVSYISYLLRPTTIVIAYFAAEGITRFAAALLTGETIGSGPLFLVGLLHRRVERKRREKFLGPLVADVVQAGDGVSCDLRIASCRPKDWGSLVTLRYAGKLYILAAHGTAPAPRRFVYQLKELPAGTVARGLRDYDPNEVLVFKEGCATNS